MLNRLALFAVVIGATMTLGYPTAAHHATSSIFRQLEEKSLTGTLVKFTNVNPHAYFYFDVKDPAGGVKSWSFEGPGPGGLRRAGIKIKDDIIPGNAYTFWFAPSRDGTNTGLLRAVLLNGKKIPLTEGYQPDDKSQRQ